MPPLMRSELPVQASTRHHWIVMVRPPHLWSGLALLVLFVWGVLYPAVLLVPVVLLAATMAFRWQTWRAERIVLTRQRVIRVQGVPETTTSEAFLRVDRVSGMRIVQSVPGKLLDYATIELEAPGSHPDVRHLVKIHRPHEFYRALRALLFTDPKDDPDEVGTSGESATERLPRVSLRKP